MQQSEESSNPSRSQARSRSYYLRHQEELKHKNREYHALNKDKVLAYRAANRDKRKEYQRQWHLKHKEHEAAYAKQRRLLFPEKTRLISRRSQEKRKEAARAAMKIWRQSHTEELRENLVRWREANKEHIRDYALAYRARPENKERHALNQRRRKALLRSLPATLTFAEWKEIKAAYDYCCAYCGEKPEVLSMDHVIPVSRGGGTTKDNIVPACLPCNRQKNAGTRALMRVVGGNEGR